MAHIERMLASDAELGSRRITVNSVAPGLTDTAGMRAVVPAERLFWRDEIHWYGRERPSDRWLLLPSGEDSVPALLSTTST